VCYRFSQPRKDPTTEMLLYALEGEILVFISLFYFNHNPLTARFSWLAWAIPIRLPSDVQRVNVFFLVTVGVPELLVSVIGTVASKSVSSLSVIQTLCIPNSGSSTIS